MASTSKINLELSSFPIELLSQIFSLACTDDGATIHSLSLVSRLFHSIALPLFYDALSLHTSEHLSYLCSLLPTLPSHLRQIHHLYVCLSPPEPRVDVSVDLQNLFAILSYASPTLETFSFVYPNTVLSSSTIARIFRTPFPYLRELSMHGFYPFPNASVIRMPMLERLHLSGNRNPYGLFHAGCLSNGMQNGKKDEGGLPSLTHLKVSGLHMASSFSMELERVIEISKDDGRPKSHNYRTDFDQIQLVQIPPRLECIVVQPGPMLSPPRGNPSTRSRTSLSGACVKKDMAMMEKLEHIAQCSQNEDGESLRVILEDRITGSEIEMKEVLYRDWRSRLDGGKGCWI
ncbi:hypothetical protein VKT23_017440 [Stygiomarasmius scandens]|uniref:F-box domain-containing protein n=1 Tax=Marasmiellus scandens TaxID=2682957 RepID=A0ABR1IWG3_9AGAR